MSKDLLKEYEYLWDGSKPGWVLRKSSTSIYGHSIINKLHGVILLVESEELCEAIWQKMKEHGCEVLEEVRPEESKSKGVQE